MNVRFSVTCARGRAADGFDAVCSDARRQGREHAARPRRGTDVDAGEDPVGRSGSAGRSGPATRRSGFRSSARWSSGRRQS